MTCCIKFVGPVQKQKCKRTICSVRGIVLEHFPAVSDSWHHGASKVSEQHAYTKTPIDPVLTDCTILEMLHRSAELNCCLSRKLQNVTTLKSEMIVFFSSALYGSNKGDITC